MSAIRLDHVLCRLTNVKAVDLARVPIGFQSQLQLALPTAEIADLPGLVLVLTQLLHNKVEWVFRPFLYLLSVPLMVIVKKRLLLEKRHSLT